MVTKREARRLCGCVVVLLLLLHPFFGNQQGGGTSIGLDVYDLLLVFIFLLTGGYRPMHFPKRNQKQLLEQEFSW